jgi:hypothetical protein
MAKEIKAVKCPHCGSTQKTELKPDYYRCNSCQTEYYLDNDDININHTYNYTNSKPLNQDFKPNMSWIGLLIGFIIISGAVILINIFKPDRPKTTYASVGSSAEPANEYYVSRNSSIGFTNADNGPVVITIGKREYNGDDTKSGFYVQFYDPINQKEIKVSKVNSTFDEVDFNLEFREFGDGNLYYILNKSRLFSIDKSALKANDITESFFTKARGLESGIASLEFAYDDYGDGFKMCFIFLG